MNWTLPRITYTIIWTTGTFQKYHPHTQNKNKKRKENQNKKNKQGKKKVGVIEKAHKYSPGLALSCNKNTNKQGKLLG